MSKKTVVIYSGRGSKVVTVDDKPVEKPVKVVPKKADKKGQGRIVVNLFEQAEAYMAVTLEDTANGFGLPVELIAPDGVEYTTSANDPTKLLAGRIDYGKTTIDPDTGEEFLIGAPSVTLRLSSLGRVPLEDETGWAIRIPTSPSVSASKVTYMVDERGIFTDLMLGRLILNLTQIKNVVPE